VYRNHAHPLAFGLEVVGNVIHAVGPFARRQPEFDEAEARAERHEARIVAQFRHASVEQQSGAVAVRTHAVVFGAARTEVGGLGRPVGFLDQTEVRARMHGGGMTGALVEVLGWTLLGAAGLALVLTPGVRAAAQRIGAIDVPGGRRRHDRPVPRLGGLGVWLAVMATVAVAQRAGVVGFTGPELAGAVAGTMVIAALGVVDDLRGMRVRWKLVLQAVAAASAVLGGWSVRAVDVPVVGGEIALGAAGIAIGFAWIVVVTNAFNLIDGLDGLAAGVGLVAAVTLVVVALLEGRPDAAVLGTALAGALAGFLVYNFQPASIFLGDTGSLLLGYWMALLSMRACAKTTVAVVMVVPVLALGFPIADTLLAVRRRSVAAGLAAIVRGDRGHLHHRLVESGIGDRRAVLVIWMGCALLGVLAFAAVLIRGPLNAVVLAVAVLALWRAVRIIDRRRSPGRDRRRRVSPR
jgi:UDP-GlcNAc:undecaprenyl-phosphate GlcNAc-1-phosphate transferase